MTDFLLILGKLNLVMAAAIIVVYLFRRPLRILFGAPVAYAIWLLVPIVIFACLLPPRVISPSSAPSTTTRFTPMQDTAAPVSVIRQIAQPAVRIAERLAGQIAPPALHIVEPLAGQSASAHPVISARATLSDFGAPDYAMVLFAVWVLGAMLMVIYLARLQARFHAAAQLGDAGPAVLGFFRPRVVIPDTFQEQFTASEQEAILVHERVHLARQDARINSLAALLRCLCWFNPLVHLGAAWLRIDQELACDATAVAGTVSRRDYASALVKSQVMVTALPLGCNWPGSQHPLIERVALLKRKRPGTARRITGAGVVMLAATSAGLGAWAAQPPVATKLNAGPQLNNQIASTEPPAMISALNQDAGNAGLNQPVTNAKPTSDNEALSLPHMLRLLPATNLVVRSPDLSQLLPVTPEIVASNDVPIAQARPASNVSPAAEVALNDQPGGSNALQEAAAKLNCAPPKLLNSLPMEKVPGSDLMTVTATIDERPEKLLVDTGTMPTQVWKARAANLDLPVQEGTRYMDLGGRSSEDVTRVARFDLGSMETGGFYARVSSDPDSSHAAFDGILGTSMMHQYDIDLDFAHHRLNYFSPEQCKGAGIYWAPSTISSVHMLWVWGLIYVPVTLDGHTLAARLDTGADRTFLNPDVAQKLFGLKNNSAEAGSVTDGGALIKAGMHIFSRLTLGGLTANNPRIGIPLSTPSSKMLPDLVIGMDLLKHSHLYISIQNQRIYVSAAGDGPPLRTPALSPTYFNVWPNPSYESWFFARDDRSPLPLQR